MAKTKEAREANQEAQNQSGRQQMARGGRQNNLARRESYYPTLWTGGPFTLMSRMMDEMNRMFEDFGSSRSPWGWLSSGTDRGLGQRNDVMWAPQIDIFERDSQLVVHADLPGMTTDEIRVEVTDHELIIQGEREQEQEDDLNDYYRVERNYGIFYRSVPLPEGVNADEVKANFRDGVLEVTMPLSQPQQRGRQINIQSNDANKGSKSSGAA